ncbi:MAG: inorganic phosphate transporter, partial [Gemmatimonadetes bacterium]|nr:inorganic phosphate transporter [Gemmatimonadota bacterium]
MTAPEIALLVLIGLAAFDLWVGVANDAVNFLNSAFGSKAASRRVIMTIAVAGVVFGALTSSGLMEVARRGVFDPSWFTDPATGAVVLSAVLAIYLGVMTADVLLLDLFNTFGLPTSTTVSIVSELVGASFAVALWSSATGFFDALNVINTGPVFGIYTGIFVSVLVAFVTSALVMWVIRLLYGRDLERSFKALGWLWTGASFSALSYFVVYKGLRSTSLLDAGGFDRLEEFLPLLLGASFTVSAVFGLVFRNRWRLVLRAVILLATGGLAVSFAGNDLVNFIGPTVAAGQAVLVEGVDLSGRVATPSWALLLAGVLMAAALVTSRKARRVTDTEIRLAANGGTADQQYKTHWLSSRVVALGAWLASGLLLLVPRGLKGALGRRTEPVPASPDDPPYDLLRASVNLVVASLLISLGTAQGLPLSTTYITFMAAMGAAFGDRVWGTGDAEARVAGILVVLGGWLLTGAIAAFAAFVMASIIYLGGGLGILAA